MAGRTWEVWEGIGEANLSSISRDVQMVNRWAGRLSSLAELAQQRAEQVYEVMRPVVDQLVNSEEPLDVHDLATGLLDTAGIEIVEAKLTERALTMMNMSKGGTILSLEGLRAHILVKEEGVKHSTFLVDDMHGTDIRRKHRPVDPGTTLEGKIYSFSTYPSVGGLMRLERSRSLLTSYVQGFVDPATGHPRVELEILTKTR